MKLKPTNEQKQIINHLYGHAMVKAGPGCAKTSTLALRVKRLHELGYSPKSIVIVTYSKGLTLDIKRTLAKQLHPAVAKKVTVKTIHGLALQLVMQYHKKQGLSRPSVLKDQRKKQFIKRYAKQNKLKISELNQAFYHYEIGNAAKVVATLGEEKAALAKSAYKAYSKYKQKRNKVDFEDMIGQALKLLKSAPDAAFLLRSYEHLMVDELQDINYPQKEFIFELCQYMESTVLVGDTHQSIYKWRNALPRYWDDLVKALAPKQFTLTRSFRIPIEALPLVNDIATRINKDAAVLTSKFEGEIPVLVDLLDQEAQHRWLAKEIKALRGKEVDITKIAILARTRKELSQTAIALRARGLNITERYQPTKINQHRAHLLALIQLVCLEQRRAAKGSKRLTQKEHELVKNHIENLWLGKKLKAILQERLAVKPKALLSVKSDCKKHYKRINVLSNALKRAAKLSNVESSVQCLIDATKAVLKDRHEYHHKLLQRDLVDIKIKARDCASLEDIDAEWFELSKKDERQGVQMMTVHSAKGQEWDYLFLINVVNGVYPRYQSKPTAQKEEKRVFYVAVTRHHKKLYLLQTPVPIKMIPKKSKVNSGFIESRILDEPSSFIDKDKQGLVYKVIKAKTTH
ncbi:MAG: ATP-dependent helicase [Methylobacter sp.]|uniref:UvrD-helicase domain-containing protein n=1 Tax=Methylobacter sp. TaxID=2051955 RepID=UPI0025D52435|nr:ATP-dependent helicase [Methylobacter sp.]MCK9619143.1 ATP-dependent helicase [Methylobacter sp.]